MCWSIPARILQPIGAILLALLGGADSLAQSNRPQHAQLSLISERSAFTTGSTDLIGLRFQLEPGWHIYWKNPGDSGEPPKVTWHLPDGIDIGELQFPTPERIKDHSLIDYGYLNDVVLLSKIRIAKAANKGSKTEMSADVRYLVCREVCIPGRATVELTVPFTASSKSADSPDAVLIRKTEAHLPAHLPQDVKVSAKSEGDSFIATITNDHANLGSINDFLPEDIDVIDNTATPRFDSNNRGGRLTLKKSEQLDHPVTQLKGLLVTADKAYEVTIPVSSSLTRVSRKAKE